MKIPKYSRQLNIRLHRTVTLLPDRPYRVAKALRLLDMGTSAEFQATAASSGASLNRRRMYVLLHFGRKLKTFLFILRVETAILVWDGNLI